MVVSGQPVELRDFFNQESLDRMLQYDWPGNVREIAMVARQARVQKESRGQVLVELGSSGTESWCFCGPEGGVGIDDPAPPKLRVVPGGRTSNRTDLQASRSRILLALAEADGNRAEAARQLGVSRSTLYRQMEKLGIGGKIESNLTAN